MILELPEDIIINIIIKNTRLDTLHISYVNKYLNKIYWDNIIFNKIPFHLPFIDSLLELYLYKLTPKIDIVRYKIKIDKNIYKFYQPLNKHIKICKECDIRICDLNEIRQDSALVYC